MRDIDAEAAKALVAGDNVQKRLLEPEELTPMAVLLASEEAKGITGQTAWMQGTRFSFGRVGRLLERGLKLLEA